MQEHPKSAHKLEQRTEQSASADAELPAYSGSGRRMSWTAHESEIMARVKSEMDKPRLTRSVRNALEADGEQAAEVLASYSKIV
jgi:hypothetical protein